MNDFLLKCRRSGFDPWVQKIPWRREWLLRSHNLFSLFWFWDQFQCARACTHRHTHTDTHTQTHTHIHTHQQIILQAATGCPAIQLSSDTINLKRASDPTGQGRTRSFILHPPLQTPASCKPRSLSVSDQLTTNCRPQTHPSSEHQLQVQMVTCTSDQLPINWRF